LYFVAFTFFQLIDDPPAGQFQHPAFERADSRVIFEAFDFPGHRDDRLLHDVLRFGVGQPFPGLPNP